MLRPAPNEEVRMTSKPNPMESRAAVKQYTEELRHQLDAPVLEVERSRARSFVRWGIGMVFVATVCGMDAWLLLRAIEEPEAYPPERVRAVERDNLCAQRQAQVMRAILHYEAERGEPPTSLPVLQARFPYLEPIDPVSERPFRYTQRGGRIVLACPNPERHDHSLHTAESSI